MSDSGKNKAILTKLIKFCVENSFNFALTYLLYKIYLQMKVSNKNQKALLKRFEMNETPPQSPSIQLDVDMVTIHGDVQNSNGSFLGIGKRVELDFTAAFESLEEISEELEASEDEKKSFGSSRTGQSDSI